MKRIALSLILSLLACSAIASDCIPSGTTDQYTYFVAVDSTDFTTRETGLSSFTVYRSRNGGTAAAFTTPTINETDTTNMPGAYELLLDEDMTIGAGNKVEHMIVHITATGMAPVTKEFCISTIDADLATAQTDLDTLTGSDGVTLATTQGNYAPATAAALATAQADLDTITGSDGVTLATAQANYAPATAAALAVTDGVADNIATYLTNNLGTAGAAATEAGGNGDHLTEAGGTGDHLSAQPWNANWDAEVQSEATDALNAYDPPTNAEMTTAIDALPTAAENATEHLTQQRVLTGTCDSGSTTTCVDDALTQASTSQLDDRLICFSDSWCALITDFTPGTDTVTTTKVAPSTRSTLGYTIFPATAQ